MDQQQPAPDPSKATAGGRWIKRAVDVHHCPKPGWSSTVKVGDQWECGTCHKVHQVTAISYGPQWDPYKTPALEWKSSGSYER